MNVYIKISFTLAIIALIISLIGMGGFYADISQRFDDVMGYVWLTFYSIALLITLYGMGKWKREFTKDDEK